MLMQRSPTEVFIGSGLSVMATSAACRMHKPSAHALSIVITVALIPVDSVWRIRVQE